MWSFRILFVVFGFLNYALMNPEAEPKCELRETYIKFETLRWHINRYFKLGIFANAMGDNLKVLRCVDALTPCSNNTYCDVCDQVIQRGVINTFNNFSISIDFLEDLTCSCMKGKKKQLISKPIIYSAKIIYP